MSKRYIEQHTLALGDLSFYSSAHVLYYIIGWKISKL